MNKRYDGKIAFVTGTSSGIGLAIATRLINEGAQVVGLARNQEKLKNVEDKFNGEFLAVSGDVTNEEDIKNAVNLIIDKFGRLDMAFNVAGGSKSGTILEQSPKDWRDTIDLCLNGVFYCIQQEARQMKIQGGGSIVNITSLNSHVPMYSGAAYCSAKAGAEMLTKNAAIELAPYHIRVNAILPGLVTTPLTKGLTDVEAIYNAYMERIPEKRPAVPEEIAAPALFLVSDDASYINGASLVVDGGWEQTGYPDLSKFF